MKSFLSYPEDFTVFSKLDRILKRREEPFKGKGKVDWAHAEQLAFGSILQDGKPIRITGQDVQRGTFAHRHLVLHDEKTGEEFVPLHHISDSNASFVAYNSPLTEFAVVGYEFGYNLEKDQCIDQFGKHNMVTLQIWLKSCLTNSSHPAIQNGDSNQAWSFFCRMHMKVKGLSTPARVSKDICSLALKITGRLQTFQVQRTISTSYVDRR